MRSNRRTNGRQAAEAHARATRSNRHVVVDATVPRGIEDQDLHEDSRERQGRIFPHALVGIAANTQQLDTAKNFIQYLYNARD
ncbi:hypothetical protein BAAM1489_05100 [Bifidobacterium animalis subsp. animalis MCC 1489]|nr:hypothetical protein BAAM1489_05100 [Bifidobacterium animalis subsp. animalis MCC 1489]